MLKYKLKDKGRLPSEKAVEARDLEIVEERWCNTGVDVLMGSLSMGRAMPMPMPIPIAATARQRDGIGGARAAVCLRTGRLLLTKSLPGTLLQ